MNAVVDLPLAGYRASFDLLAPRLPGDTAQRRQNFQRFLHLGFPSRREERWRYTDLKALADTRFDMEPVAPSLQPPAIDGTDRIVFVNGIVDEGLGDGNVPHGLRDLASTDGDGIVALNAALAGDGLNLEVARNTRLPRPLHVVNLRSAGASPSMSHLRHRIVLGENSEATVILHSVSTAACFATETVDVQLAQGARLRLYRVQEESAEATLLARIDVQLGRDATLDVGGFDFGGGLVRQDLNLLLDGEGAEVSVHGLFSVDGRAHVDNQLRIEHRAPRCRSRAQFRAIVGGRAKAVFDGLVVVAPGAVKTDSDQQVASLLLSPGAEINAKPELEIYNDDVRCSHGAATGQLDEQALFYLRSRGVDALAAKSLLTRAFAHRVLEAISLEPLRVAVEQRLDARLCTLLDAQEQAT